MDGNGEVKLCKDSKKIFFFFFFRGGGGSGWGVRVDGNSEVKLV